MRMNNFQVENREDEFEEDKEVESIREEVVIQQMQSRKGDEPDQVVAETHPTEIDNSNVLQSVT